MSKKCSFCGNQEIVHKSVHYIYRQDEKFLIVNDVPCEECSFCGEQYFAANVLKKIENEFNEIHFAGKKASKMLKVPVENYALVS
jgi:YgiT-type zinc finger domain-containing protein